MGHFNNYNNLNIQFVQDKDRQQDIKDQIKNEKPGRNEIL